MAAGEVRNHEACAGTALPLGERELGGLPAALPHWTVVDGRLRRTVACASFAEAIDFVMAAAALSERRNHHPRFCVDKRSVTMSLWTRMTDSLTRLDVELAHDLDRLAAERVR